MTGPAVEESYRWRYTFSDLLTNQPFGTLPLVDADLSERIGGPADGAGKVPVSGARARARNPWAKTTPRRTIMWAQRVTYRNGAEAAAPCLWHGIIWKRQRGPSLSLSLATPESYYAHRLVRRDRSLVGMDTAEALAQVFRDAEETPQGRLGLLYDVTPSGEACNRVLLGSDLKTVLETAQAIASDGSGLHWRIRPGVDPVTGEFTKTLEVAPRLGRAGVAELRWKSGGAGRAASELIGYSDTDDGTGVSNDFTGLGDGQGTAQLRSRRLASAVGNTELDDGFPLLEGVGSGGAQLQSQAAVDTYTESRLAASLAGERVIDGVTVRGDRPPTLDRYTLGDEVTLELNDPSQPAPYEHHGLLLARRILPGQPKRNETVGFTLGSL